MSAPVPAGPTPSFNLRGKVALVTGGSRGIGRSIVHALAGAGADVIIASRKLANCEAVANEVRSAYGVQAIPRAFHAAHWDEATALAEYAYSEFGHIDVLVNDAGMSPLFSSLTDITEDYYDKVQGVNLKGPFRLSTLVGTQMAEGDGGSIINVSTVGSLRPGANEIVYVCAKAGLNALTIALAGELGPKVRVNALLPGAVDTDIMTAWPDGMREASAASTPLGRVGVADDYAGPALWLASEASGWVTGTIIRVDGGSYRQMS